MNAKCGLCCAAVLLVVGLAPAVADDSKSCTSEPKDKWRPQTDAEAAAKAAGYEVRKSKVDGTCYEVYGVDKAGALHELFYDPVAMTLVRTIKKG